MVVVVIVVVVVEEEEEEEEENEGNKWNIILVFQLLKIMSWNRC